MLKYTGALRAIFLINFSIGLASLCLAVQVAAQTLVATDSSGNPLYCRDLDPENGFAIGYIHSVAQSPVIDFFRVHDGCIVLDRTVYEDFGAGLPSAPQGGQMMRAENGKIIMSGYNLALPVLEVRVGRVARHELMFFNDGGNEIVEKIPLSNLASPGKAISFSIKDK